jgi:hypothetical protein
MRAALLALTILCTSGCAAILNVGSTVEVRHIEQRGAYDCAVAALAMLLEKSYDDIEATRLALKIPLDGGLYLRDMDRIVRRYGRTLDVRDDQQFPFPTGRGLVTIERTDGAIHAVFIDKARVHDPMKPFAEAWVLARQEWKRVLYVLVVT